MLNLRPIFIDAIGACERHAAFLRIAPLPAAIFMMQQDVVNHYQYALTHYLPVRLDAPFLQNSSLGSPYEKWAKFTNDDFEILSFTIHGLLRYTSRLVHETECRALRAHSRFSLMKDRSNAYTDPLCEIRHDKRTVGVRVEPDQALSITPLGATLETARLDISDRAVIAEFQERCQGELDTLVADTKTLGQLCNELYGRRPVAEEFDALNESWWT